MHSPLGFDNLGLGLPGNHDVLRLILAQAHPHPGEAELEGSDSIMLHNCIRCPGHHDGGGGEEIASGSLSEWIQSGSMDSGAQQRELDRPVARHGGRQ